MRKDILNADHIFSQTVPREELGLAVLAWFLGLRAVKGLLLVSVAGVLEINSEVSGLILACQNAKPFGGM